MVESVVVHRVGFKDDSPVYFFGAWSLLQAGWLRKADARSTAICWYAGSILLSGGLFLPGLVVHLPEAVNNLWSIAFVVVWVAGIFMFRRDMQRYFNTTDNVGLGLSRWMTLFFNVVYFQYHLHDIAEFRRRHPETDGPVAG
jgi:hypothetical protein